MSIVVIVTVVLTGLSSSLYAQGTDVIRDSAMRMLGASLLVPGIAAYCEEHVERNPGLLEAAKKWNGRNAAIMHQTVKAIKLTGGVSKEEKVLLDSLAFKLTKQFVDSDGNQKQVCRNFLFSIENGSLDLDRREDLADASKLIYSLRNGKFHPSRK